MSSFFDGVLSDLKLANEVPESVVHLLEKKFNKLDSLFTGLTTAYQQQKFFKKHFHKIVSLHIKGQVHVRICTFIFSLNLLKNRIQFELHWAQDTAGKWELRNIIAVL